jgi:hypothetical protein
VPLGPIDLPEKVVSLCLSISKRKVMGTTFGSTSRLVCSGCRLLPWLMSGMPSSQIGLPALVDQRVMSLFEGNELSDTLRVLSTPATGNPFGSSRPTCTSTEAWSQ